VTTETAVQALLRVLDLLDAEDWEGLVGELSDDAELADELTSTWLRGRERVAAYLRASAGIVTDIRSEPSSIHSRILTLDEAIVTFDLRQRYRLDGVEQRRDLTGCAAFRTVDGVPRLSLFHLGEVAEASSGGERAAEAPPTDGERAAPALGARLRVLRRAKGLSLRALAERSGVSASFLSQLERARSNASVGSLARIAEALGVPASELLGEERPSGALRASRWGDQGWVRLHELGLTVMTFPGLPSGRLESWLGELAPNAPAFAPMGGDATERFLYVLEGSIAIVGPEHVVLAAGEGAYLRSADYRLAAEGDVPARYLCTQIT
jgi:transcriptional regulator with XRE-family HTH domain